MKGSELGRIIMERALELGIKPIKIKPLSDQERAENFILKLIKPTLLIVFVIVLNNKSKKFNIIL